MDVCSGFSISFVSCFEWALNSFVVVWQPPCPWELYTNHNIGTHHVEIDQRIDGVLANCILLSQPREFSKCLESSLSSSKDANCCHYAFSLVLDSTRNLYGCMPSYSGIGNFCPGANGTSPSLQNKLFQHSISLHVVPTNYSENFVLIRNKRTWYLRI